MGLERGFCRDLAVLTISARRTHKGRMMNFSDLQLDAQLLNAVERLGFEEPTRFKLRPFRTFSLPLRT